MRAFGPDCIVILCFASTDLIFCLDCIESLCFASAGVVLYCRCSGILGVFQCRSVSGDWFVVCSGSRLYRDFVFRVNWCCFWSRLYRHFLFFVARGDCELQCIDVICVGMCSFVWRGTSGCIVMFSRSRPGITCISVAGVRLYR